MQLSTIVSDTRNWSIRDIDHEEWRSR